VRDVGEMERAVTAFAHGSNGGLIVASSTLAQVRVSLAIRERLATSDPGNAG